MVSHVLFCDLSSWNALQRHLPEACINTWFIFHCQIVFLSWIYHILFIFSLADRYLDCFHVLIKKISVIIHVKLLYGFGFHSLGYISRSVISGHMTIWFKHWETSGLFFMVFIVLHVAVNNVRGALFLYNSINVVGEYRPITVLLFSLFCFLRWGEWCYVAQAGLDLFLQPLVSRDYR